MEEREITEPVDLCTPSGRLSPDAVGWSRRPLHRCNIPGWGRRKRWDYWCVTAGPLILSATYASADYLGLATAYVCDLESGTELEKTAVVPLAAGMRLPETVGGGDLTFRGQGLALSFREEAGGTRISVETRSRRHGAVAADVLVGLPEGHETLGVVIPWSSRRFQYTSKHNARPASGTVEIGAERHDVGSLPEPYGCLDYGRGVWRYRSRWNWGSASGRVGGRVLGLQLGGTWTDGTGSTENSVTVEGVLTKISEDLTWVLDLARPERPWSVTSDETDAVRLEFRPRHLRRTRVEAGVIGIDIPQHFGEWSGTVRDAAGTVHTVDGLFGWAEDARMRW